MSAAKPNWVRTTLSTDRNRRLYPKNGSTDHGQPFLWLWPNGRILANKSPLALGCDILVSPVSSTAYSDEDAQ